MEILANIKNTKQYHQDVIQTQLREIFEPELYIAPKGEFFDIKEKLQELFLGFSKQELSINEQINEKFLNLDFGSEFEIDATKIGIQDAIFFINLLNQEKLINYNVSDDGINLNIDGGKKIEITKSLMNVLQSSIDTNKPIRLDFENDITVVLKLDKEGKIQAHFIPGTSETEAYLKNNISCLKQRFDEEEINYSSLSYSKNKEQNQRNSQNKKRSNKWKIVTLML